MQQHLPLIPHAVEGQIIHQRASDGYVNATAMCNAVGKKFNDYRRLSNTAEYLNELTTSAGIPADVLIYTITTGLNEGRGTWVHPDVAIHLAQWLSPKFAVAVSQWVREWMSGETTQSAMPHHIKRYMINRAKIPHTHFSMLNELTINLIAPLEDSGYIVPDNLVPDISEGRIFCKWLRDVRKVDTDTFLKYQHEYPDGRVFNAKLYPIEYLPDFRWHFNEVWLPQHAPKYFGGRDKKALAYITRILLSDLVA